MREREDKKKRKKEKREVKESQRKIRGKKTDIRCVDKKQQHKIKEKIVAYEEKKSK